MSDAYPDHKLPDSVRCPACGAQLDGALATSGRRAPRPGDATLCSYCASALTFDGDPIYLRFPTDDELQEYATDPRMARIRAVVMELIRRHAAG